MAITYFFYPLEKQHQFKPRLYKSLTDLKCFVRPHTVSNLQPPKATPGPRQSRLLLELTQTPTEPKVKARPKPEWLYGPETQISALR